ncbi:MAG: NAD(P)-dependent oxidoreductase, partial [bacterium]|nr:NAD(P)-dependent oxidoreductase [bacterium]
VGSVLIPLLLESSCSVRVVDRLLFGGHGLIPYFINPRFQFVQGDIRDERTMAEAVKGVDAIIHLAAIVGFPACKKDPHLAETTNFEGTVLLNKLRDKSNVPIIMASTGSNYGYVADGICREDTPLNPLTIYGTTKTRAEQHLLDAGNVVIYRYATAFGLSPRLRLDLLINDFVFTALSKNFLLIYEKDFKRTFIHVRDMARSFVFALDHVDKMKDNIYNVGNEMLNLSKADVAEYLKTKFDYFLEYADTGSDPDQRNYEVDYSKIRKAGFHTTIGFEDGVDELIRGLKMIEIHNPYSNV